MDSPRVASFEDCWLCPPYMWKERCDCSRQLLAFVGRDWLFPRMIGDTRSMQLCVVALRGNLDSYERRRLVRLFANHSQ